MGLYHKFRSLKGAHILKDDCTQCPSCHFPAIYSEFMKYLENEITCPMCSNHISRHDVKKLDSVEDFLKSDDSE